MVVVPYLLLSFVAVPRVSFTVSFRPRSALCLRFQRPPFNVALLPPHRLLGCLHRIGHLPDFVPPCFSIVQISIRISSPSVSLMISFSVRSYCRTSLTSYLTTLLIPFPLESYRLVPFLVLSSVTKEPIFLNCFTLSSLSSSSPISSYFPSSPNHRYSYSLVIASRGESDRMKIHFFAHDRNRTKPRDVASAYYTTSTPFF